MKKLFVLAFIFLSLSSQAVLLDKTIAIFNDDVITLSQIKRVRNSLAARKNIIPQIYYSTKMSNKEVVKIKIERAIIREKLNSMGYVTNDEEVERNIKQREKMLRINRRQLIAFLKNNNMTFDEYFEITREALENQRFTQWIIQPLVSITEQEIKNAFYKKNLNNKTLSFKYNLVDFTLPKSRFKKKGRLKSFRPALARFQTSGVLPDVFKDVNTNVLGEITEENLTSKLKKLLKRTEEGSFSQPILIGRQYHVFFVKKKDLVESELFLKNKNRIRGELFEKSMAGIQKIWFEGEKSKHYIRYFF